MFNPKIISPDGKPLNTKTDRMIDTAFVVFLEPNGGPALFDVNVKFPGIQLSRQATLEDIHRMCLEVAADVNNMKQSQQIEKVLTLREKVKEGKVVITSDGKIMPGPNSDPQEKPQEIH
jgi:hypothetical protein